MTPFQFARRTSFFGLAGILILHSAVSVADDTEIFFGTQPDNDTRPNVLFILDDSGSMNWCINSNKTCNPDNRMKALKETMTNLLNTTSGVNVGLMVMNNSAGTPGDSSVPRLLQPVDDIDAPINVKVSSPEIKVSADDASRYNGSNNISDPTLVMGYIKNPSTTGTVVRSLGAPNTYSNNNTTYYVRNGFTCSVKMDATSECPAGKITEINSGSGNAGQDGLLLFRNLNIPKGVTITSATLDLTPVIATGSTTFNLSLVNSKTPEAFNHSSPLVSTFTANTARASAVSAGVHSLNVTSLLADQQNLTPTLNPIGDLAIRLRATNRNDFSYAVGDVENAPQLTITYTGAENTDRTTGLRFQTVNIPQGATITRATLNFVPASSDDRTVSFNVAAEASDNASDFSGGDFSLRPKTSTNTWTPAPWSTANPPVYTESGADVTSQVQEVVNRGGWCGNNSMAFFLTPSSGDGGRTAVSQDGNDGFKPTLSISYTGGDNGCTKPIVDLSLVDDKDDARQFRTGSWWNRNNRAVSVNESILYFDDDYTYVGARFQQVPFKNGATIEEARLIVTPSSAKNTTVTANVYFENVGNSAAFNTSNNNLGQRAATTSATCTFTSQGPGIPVSCEAANLKTALQNVLARSDWKDGNALSVLIKQTSGSSNLSINAFESSKAAAIRLQVKLAKGTDLSDNTYKVRDYLKGVVNDMQANNGTPIVELMYQGASYYTALSGKHKGPTSPIQSSCQANYLVLMTDGQANSNNATTVSNAKNLTGGSCVPRDSGEQTNGETCGVELAKWLNSTDQSSTLDGDNLVTTHTVGFALQASEGAKKYLEDIATAGGGKAYTANDANALANAFNSIIQEALATDTTFVSATAPVNSFNRQDHKDQLYFSLFRPSTTDRWPGNLKRYRMGIQNGSPLVLDQDDTPAIDVNTGFFRSNARSWWTNGNDGSNVAAGGAANKLPTPDNRNLLTNIDGNTTLNRLDTNLTPAQIGAKDNAERDALINYIRGYETGTTSLRMALGDPIHSTPSVVTYGCSARDNAGNCISEIESAILGTNEGFLQMFDTNTGIEQFAFMPNKLLGNIKRLSANANTGDLDHVYGMDNSVTVWAEDTNENGEIDSGEFVYAYASMGRGGRNLYALDITNPTSPKIMWIIQGGSDNFTRLGQTWSAPIKTKIKVGGTITDVLIFGGGYDPNQDPLKNQTNVRRTDTQGNDLFIVNAKTGAKLWSASSAGIDMKYSVPSKAAVIGLQTDATGQPALNPEGLATQIFVGDMGGQVWRFLINNGGSGNNLASGNVFANVAGDDEASARRFYNEPAIALLSANNKVYLTVNIGSGYRGHPLDKVIQDRFYSFRTEELNKLDTTLTESSLYNATSLLTAGPDQQQAILDKKGWFITLASNGEKALSNTLAISGNLYFNTYQPVPAQSACSATLGISRGYRVNLLDGTAVDNTRFTVLKGATLPSNPQVYCKGDTCWAYNDPSQLVRQPENECKEGESCDQEVCKAGQPCAYDMASKSRLYWTDKSEEK
ncbi:PilC/PilY family type IV pilus protein [Pseudomonas sp. AA-38]|uniref:PilC/PilY family type IV pilus protein n=1 Tax=Pseudomonas sp. AA-38 TaxID=3028807 RepID=UPI0023FA0F56|nr:PilC/PilY family type IV pilus protein [Pseudomonas sp. AA-38]